MYDPQVATPTQARIAQATADLITAHGMSGVTHRAVAARVELSLGTVTKYFPSASSLRAAGMRVLADAWDAEIEHIRTALAADPPHAVTALSTYLHTYLSDVTGLRSEAALIVHTIFDDTLHELGLTWYRNFHTVLRTYTSPTAAQAISTYLDGLIITTATTGQPPTHTALHTTLTALWSL